MTRPGDLHVDRMREIFGVSRDKDLAIFFDLNKVAISHWRLRGVPPKYDTFWVGDYSFDTRLCLFAMHHGVTEALRIAQRMGAPSLSLDAAKAILIQAVNAGRIDSPESLVLSLADQAEKLLAEAIRIAFAYDVNCLDVYDAWLALPKGKS